MEFARRLPMGSETFEGPLDTHAGRLYVYSFGVDIDPQNGGKPVHLTFTVAQTEDQFERQVSTYRRTQFLWLATLGLMLILLQLLLLRWSLLPLRRVSSDLALIERGDREHLEGPYPVELMGLTARLNAFIDSERDQRTRYQNTLADLAHSLKTPLAVVRSQLEAGLDVARADVLDQVRRMDEIDPSKQTVLHCKMGGRSAQAIQMLRQAGFTGELRNLRGGITAWSNDVDPKVPKY